MKKLGLLFILALACLNMDLKAQDAAFSQFYANQLYLNPALAGSARCPRVTLNYRNQWPNFSGDFITTSITYDQYVDALKGGFGIILMSDQIAKTLNCKVEDLFMLP